MQFFIKKVWLVFIALNCLFLLQTNTLLASDEVRTLKVSLLIFSVEQRNAFEELAVLFNKRNPNVEIKYVSADDTNYKKNSALWLENPEGIDVLNWPWPSRFEEYVEAGWIEPITDLWQSPSMIKNYGNFAKSLVSVKEKQYAVPYSAGYWGFFYRESLFREFDLSPPENWQDFLNVCQTLKDNQITPIVIGTKHPWPTASWFDFLNLRINGIEFHRQVVKGQIPFSSERIYNVFDHWLQVIQRGCFNRGAIHVDIRQTLPLIYRRSAGMTLSGSYVTTQIPPGIRDDFRFFRFPIIDDSIALSEETPIDMFLIPTSSKNKVAAKTFLMFMAEAEPQRIINGAINYLPVNKSASIDHAYFTTAAQNTLTQATSYTQYFDRDAPFDFASEALGIFAEFMEDGDIKKAQSNLELARQTYFFAQ